MASTKFRAVWQGDGKFRYFSGIQAILDYFTPDEIADMQISLIFGSVVVSEIDNKRIAEEAESIRIAQK